MIRLKKISVFSLIFLSIDILIKFIVKTNMEVFSKINIIPNFFSIMYVKNTGAAFSILEGNRILLIAISLIAIVLIYYFLIKNSNLNKFDIFCYSMLIGGVLGNLLDRIIYGYVIDYLCINLFDFPIFNLADIYIVLSVILIILKSFKETLWKR